MGAQDGLAVSVIRPSDDNRFRPLSPTTTASERGARLRRNRLRTLSTYIPAVFQVTAMPTPELPSVDVDLQDLYEQVLAGFNDEHSPELPTPIAQKRANPSDPESLYNSYAEDPTDPSSKLSRNASYTIASQRTQTSTWSRSVPPVCFD